MKRSLRWFAGSLALVSVAAWLALGANLGWTKTSVMVRTLDPVTGLESADYRPKFLPGIELLVVALAGAGGLASVPFLFGNSTKTDY